MGVDLTVVVTAHSESIVAGPTMRSAEAAVGVAESAGFRVERLIGLDAASERCRAFFTQPAMSRWFSVALDERDLGLARNALAKLANGRWLAFLDADDLFSENWLVEGARMLARAEAGGEKVILHPEVNVFFDGMNSALGNIAGDSALSTPYYWYVANYYDSLAIAPQEAFSEAPYVGRDRERGFGYEDWRWNLDTIAAGWQHAVVKDTIIFKRRRDMSLVFELAQKRSLLWDMEIMAIDQISESGSRRASQRIV